MCVCVSHTCVANMHFLNCSYNLSFCFLCIICNMCDRICINQPYAANYNFPVRAIYGA